MADNKRIFYALQQVEISDGTTSRALQGVQSVGLSSTTNIESFSAFGSIDATSILQDMDLEVTIENGLGSDWNNALAALGYTSGNSWNFGSFDFDTGHTITLTYKMSDSEIQTITLSGILTGYSVQMGTDGPATESVTFQNQGTSVFVAGSKAAGTLPAQNQSLCDVITRPNFTSFATTEYPDCCASVTTAPSSYSNVTSFSAGFDISNEKISVLGQSLPFGKFASFPAETSAEVEFHLDPSGSIGGLNSGSVTGSSLDDKCYDIAITLPGNTFSMEEMRHAGTSRSGGDVGGGNVTISDSYTGFNTFQYDGTAAYTPS